MYSRLNRICCGAHFLVSIRSKSFDGVKLLRYDPMAPQDSYLKGSRPMPSTMLALIGGRATSLMLQGCHENHVRAFLRAERRVGDRRRVG
jgi:hypothetical protein